MSDRDYKFFASTEDELITNYGRGNTPEEAIEDFLAGPVHEAIVGDEYQEVATLEVFTVEHHPKPCSMDEDCEHEEFFIFDDRPCSWITDRRIKTVQIAWDYDEEAMESTNFRVEGGTE